MHKHCCECEKRMVVKHQLQDELTSQDERRGKARDFGRICNSLFPLKKKESEANGQNINILPVITKGIGLCVLFLCFGVCQKYFLLRKNKPGYMALII